MRIILEKIRNIFFICIKEYHSIFRNRTNWFILVAFPVLQILLYGYVVDKDPKFLPTMLNIQDNSVFSKTIVQNLKNTHYFKIVGQSNDLDYLHQMMDRGEIQFIITIPYNFTREIIQNKVAHIYVENDATEPLVSINAIFAIEKLAENLIAKDLSGPLGYINKNQKIVEPIVINRYNPEREVAVNVLPPLISLIITVTILYIASISIVREYEKSTIELLFSLGLKSDEIIIGKLIPYIFIAYLQLIICSITAHFFFGLSTKGSFLSILIVTFPFVIANLAISAFISCLVQNTFQAIQASSLYFLPSIILGGYLYPIEGMPQWAQSFSKLLPLTNFVYIIRSIVMKGTSLFALNLSILKLFICFIIFFLLTRILLNRTT